MASLDLGDKAMNPFVMPNPLPRVLSYPVAVGIVMAVVVTSLLLIVSNKFDPTGGVYTISILILIAFLGELIYTSIFSVPTDEVTASIIGGLIAAVGSIVTYWLSRGREPPK
jgi:hypothetical protein